MVVQILGQVDVLPILAPLLSVRRYGITLSLNPFLHERDPSRPLHYSLTCYSNMLSRPVTLEVLEPMAGGAHTFDLSAALLERAPGEDFENGYFVLQRDLNEPDGKRLFYKPAVWVAYTTPSSYLIIPAGVPFASLRMFYSPEKLSQVIEYFGHVCANDRMSSVLVSLNPFPGDTEGELSLFADQGREPVTRHKIRVQARTVEHIDLEPLIPEHLRGVPLALKAVTNHRLIYFIMYKDKRSDIFYAADHSLSWKVIF